MAGRRSTEAGACVADLRGGAGSSGKWSGAAARLRESNHQAKRDWIDPRMSAKPLPFVKDSKGPTAGVVTVTLEPTPGKPVVILDRAMFERLDATLDAIGASAKGLVLASSSERAFVAGADLKTISSASDAELSDYLTLGARVMGRIAHLHCPTVAAVNGACLGGGLELAMHCDAMIASLAKGAKAYQVGLPEAGLGLCPGWGGTNMLPARMDAAEAIRLIASGQTMSVEYAREARLFDELVEPGALVEEAKELASTMTKGAPEREPRCIHEPEWREKARDALHRVRAELPKTKAAKAVALAVDTGLDLGWEPALGVERNMLVYLRKTPEAKALIDKFFSKG